MKKRKISVCFLLILPFALLSQKLELASIFGSNMVLQQGIHAPIWGKAKPNSTITLTINENKVTTIADANGNWNVKTPKLKAGGPYEVKITTLEESIVLTSVLVGEVWLASGQSNMAYRLFQIDKEQTEINKANYENIRFFSAANKINNVPLEKVYGEWKTCIPKNARDFSAVAYFFARELHLDQNIPVGVIVSATGGTPVEAWTSAESLLTNPDFKDSVIRYQKLEESWEKMMDEFFKTTKNMNPKPAPPAEKNYATAQYNGMIAPIIPYGIKGVIWYQGENNAGKAKQYQTLFPLLINDWRNKWNNDKLPFIYVQLANFKARNEQPVFYDGWASLREAQTMALKLPKTGMAVAIDIGEADDIHPKNKLDVGKRLFLAASRVAYNKKIVYSGPLYESVIFKNNKATISFKEIGGGLIIKGDTLKGFAIAGEDKKFYWANAEIVKNKIVLSCSQVEKPVAVRYAWAINPECNLYNKEGLPAIPFRTDNW